MGKSTATGPNELTIGWRLIPTPGRAGEVYVLEVLLHSIHTSNVSVTELYYARLHEFGNGGTSLAHVIDLPTYGPTLDSYQGFYSSSLEEIVFLWAASQPGSSAVQQQLFTVSLKPFEVARTGPVIAQGHKCSPGACPFGCPLPVVGGDYLYLPGALQASWCFDRFSLKTLAAAS